jgi:hypothetical protein
MRELILKISTVIGWIFLLIHLLTSPFKFEVKWVFFFMGIILMISIPWMFLMFLYEKVAKKDLYTDSFFNRKKTTHQKIPWIFYPPGEDGFFLVPLLYVGIHYLTAGISAFLFALFHYPRFAIWECIPKGLAFFCIALFILPKSGILPLAVGHLLTDGIAFYVLPRILHEFKYFYENGVLMEEGMCKNAKREGLVKYYYPSGKLQSECFYTKDILNGPCKWFFENGHIEKEGSYQNGQLQGLWKWFNEDGVLSTEAHYENDHIIGEPKSY